MQQYHQATGATLLSFEQFEQFPNDGMKHELLQGEHVILSPPKFAHNSLQHKILFLLKPYDQHRLGQVRIIISSMTT